MYKNNWKVILMPLILALAIVLGMFVNSLFVGKGTLPVRLQGIVTNRKGEALPGATVLEKKTGRGTSTDIYGRFELDVAMGNEVVVSFIGYASQAFVCTDSSVLQIVLEEESLFFEDILVTAFGIG